MEDNYPKAYKEVIEILNFIPQESVDKIPKVMIDTFRKKMDVNYDFTVDINKNFEQQDLLDETKAIFANIFRDYWATPHQKEIIEAKEQYDRQNIEEGKKAKYNPNDIFKNKKLIKNSETIKLNVNEYNFEKNLPAELKKERFYYKLINFIKKLFK